MREVWAENEGRCVEFPLILLKKTTTSNATGFCLCGRGTATAVAFTAVRRRSDGKSWARSFVTRYTKHVDTAIIESTRLQYSVLHYGTFLATL